MIKVVAFAKSNSGVDEHRIKIPFRHMPDVDVTFTSNFDETVFNGADVVIYNRTLPGESTLWLLRMKKEHGFKICVDVDDYWHLGKNHILYDQQRGGTYAIYQEMHLGEADVVFCTHERLAEMIRPINSNVHIIPNAITRREQQFDIQTNPGEYVRLFWQGSRTHKADIEILNHPINQLKRIGKKLELYIAGVETLNEDEIDPYWVSMIESYCGVIYRDGKVIDNGLLDRHQYFLGLAADQYYGLYKEADVCLIPLVHNTFNRYKSNLKVLEAANMGLPVIASQVHPYLNLPVSYCIRSSDWVEHIKRLVGSAVAREDEGAKLKEFADIHFNFDKINNERRQILEHEISRSTVS